MSEVQDRILELLQQRDAIDEELSQLRTQAEQELAEAQALVARLSNLGDKPAQPVVKAPTALSETDYGNGIGGREADMTREDFNDELAELRERTAVKRARLA